MMNIVNFMIMAMVMVLLMVKIIIIMKKCSKSRRCVRGVGGGQIGLSHPPTPMHIVMRIILIIMIMMTL